MFILSYKVYKWRDQGFRFFNWKDLIRYVWSFVWMSWGCVLIYIYVMVRLGGGILKKVLDLFF